MNFLRRALPRRTTLGRRGLWTHQHLLHQRQAQDGNITRNNFWSSLESFKAHLHLADFVAFDLELSGIHGVPPSESSEACPHSPLTCSYDHIKHLAEKFTILQVGFALFRFDPATNRFLAYPYNFYIFPRDELSLGLPAATFTCEYASLEFLASHGFDLNLCIKDGISYLSKTQEAEARVLLADERFSFVSKWCHCSKTSRSTSDLLFSERLRVQIEAWQNEVSTSGGESNTIGIDVADISRFMSHTKVKAFKVPHQGVLSKHPSYTLNLENHHQVCLAQAVLDKHFEYLLPVVRSDCTSGASHEITLFFSKSKEDANVLKSKLEQGFEPYKINEAVGFRHVVDALVSSGRPLIGHNCALDLAHIHSKFISPLPSSVEYFSSSLLKNFPLILDTKYLMKSEPSLRASWIRKQTSLNMIYSHMCKPIRDVRPPYMRLAIKEREHSKAQIDIMPGFKRYQDANHKLLHEAGYDAFMTGCVFAQICHQLRVDVRSLPSIVDDSPHSSPFQELANSLNLGSGILDLRTGKWKEMGVEPKDLEEIPATESHKLACYAEV